MQFLFALNVLICSEVDGGSLGLGWLPSPSSLSPEEAWSPCPAPALWSGPNLYVSVMQLSTEKYVVGKTLSGVPSLSLADRSFLSWSEEPDFELLSDDSLGSGRLWIGTLGGGKGLVWEGSWWSLVLNPPWSEFEPPPRCV
ncbi:hypothetical protein JZ751_005814 [Albula glossodonta]|uniref:Uncharacterized protein n=1 Tax=Albula glossodonta TaxID=121402 RepID=A0A8T2PDR5_9TELE|nr:hypothetical protein JZ751_005814 [Albula glossodonta]